MGSTLGDPEKYPQINSRPLHSVQGTAMELAHDLDIPYDESLSLGRH